MTGGAGSAGAAACGLGTTGGCTGTGFGGSTLGTTFGGGGTIGGSVAGVGTGVGETRTNRTFSLISPPVPRDPPPPPPAGPGPPAPCCKRSITLRGMKNGTISRKMITACSATETTAPARLPSSRSGMPSGWR